MASTLTATEARVRFGEMLRRVVEGGETIIVERGGDPQVAVISIAEYERLRAYTRGRDALARAASVRERMRARLGDRELEPAEDVIRKGREERDEDLTGLR